MISAIKTFALLLIFAWSNWSCAQRSHCTQAPLFEDGRHVAYGYGAFRTEQNGAVNIDIHNGRSYLLSLYFIKGSPAPTVIAKEGWTIRSFNTFNTDHPSFIAIKELDEDGNYDLNNFLRIILADQGFFALTDNYRRSFRY